MKYGISNFRRLEKVEPIELKRITILVGRNSSGKSSYLRSLLLLKQSIITKTNSPILWYGHIVDFGSFKDTVINHDLDKSIAFKVEFDSFPRAIYPLSFFSSREGYNSDFLANLTYEVTIKSQRSATSVVQINLSLQTPKIEYLINFNEKGELTNLKLNNKRVESRYFKSLRINTDSIFPDIISSNERHIGNEIFPSWGFFNHYYQPSSVIIASIRDIIKTCFKSETHLSEDDLNKIMQYFSANCLKLLSNDLQLTKTEKHINKHIKPFLQEISKNKTLKTKFLQSLSLLVLPEIMQILSMYFDQYINNATYLGPARARSERYYRYQELAVTEIDPDGKNLPMFLKSLTNDQIQKLSKWIEDKFGYGIKISDSEGHISIVQFKDNIETNIVDTGYGLSQILPVLAQVWWAQQKPKRKPINLPNLIMIEQPELHLHPAHQSLLADAFVHEAKKTQLNFLIETHSESMINRLGALVANGDINSDDINIVIFSDDDQKQNVSTTQIATFDDDGCLINWPYGFFQL